jgi:predicted O-linked N-acetylglucosamine transferase (SPINDLY family)
MDDDAAKETVVGGLVARGVHLARIETVGRLPFGEFFGRIQNVDITLDTFPYSGGTTTFWSLFLGVPVLSLAGGRWASLQSLSILSRFGLTDWSSVEIGDLLRFARFWDENHALLSKLRGIILTRAALEREVGAREFTNSFEVAIERAWSDWVFQREDRN